MNRKLKIIIFIVAIIALIAVITNIAIDQYNIYQKQNKVTEKAETSSKTSEEETTKLSDILYNEETGEYYMIDETTGEVAHTSYNESDLYIYTIDPDYDPKIPASDLEDPYNEVIDE